MPDGVRAVFARTPSSVRRKLLALRRLIFATAAAEGVGALDETLRWGQPAYRAARSRSGTTVRIDRHRSHPSEYALS
jgi:hypothetical protein